MIFVFMGWTWYFNHLHTILYTVRYFWTDYLWANTGNVHHLLSINLVFVDKKNNFICNKKFEENRTKFETGHFYVTLCCKLLQWFANFTLYFYGVVTSDFHAKHFLKSLVNLQTEQAINSQSWMCIRTPEQNNNSICLHLIWFLATQFQQMKQAHYWIQWPAFI